METQVQTSVAHKKSKRSFWSTYSNPYQKGLFLSNRELSREMAAALLAAEQPRNVLSIQLVNQEEPFLERPSCPSEMETPAVSYSPYSTEVKDFIRSNPEVKLPLEEAKSQIYKFFGNVTVSLRVYRDHDDPFDEELKVDIHTPYNAEESMKRRDSFLTEWWVDNMDEANGKLGFGLVFK